MVMLTCMICFNLLVQILSSKVQVHCAHTYHKCYYTSNIIQTPPPTSPEWTFGVPTGLLWNWQWLKIENRRSGCIINRCTQLSMSCDCCYLCICLLRRYLRINNPLHVTVACLVESYRMVATGLGLGFIYAHTMIYRTVMGALHDMCVLYVRFVCFTSSCVCIGDPWGRMLPPGSGGLCLI